MVLRSMFVSRGGHFFHLLYFLALLRVKSSSSYSLGVVIAIVIVRPLLFIPCRCFVVAINVTRHK